MNSRTRRSVLRVSLRTLFVLLTVVCIVLGWQTNVVRNRRAAIQELKPKGYIFTTAEMWSQRFPPGFPPPSTAKVSRVRSWLGDEAIQEIWYSWYPTPTATELDRLKQLFPEAQLQEIPAEPCHPGCFPKGTLVETPTGPRPIEEIAKGDAVIVVKPGSQATTATAQTIFVTDNRLWKVQTDAGDLVTTQTQPLCLTTGATTSAGELKSGDVIFYSRNGELTSAVVRGVVETNRIEPVFNIVLGGPELFIANGFVVRSKPPADPNNRRLSATTP